MQTAKQKLKRAAPWLFLLLVLAGLAAVRGLAANYEIGYEIMNGDFQNYNPVRHLLAGQVPYRDFTVYLGAGELYSVGGLLLVLGNSFGRSMFATNFCTWFYFELLVLAVCLVVIGTARAARAAALALCSVFFAYVQGANLPFAGQVNTLLIYAAANGNSARMMRSAALTLAVLVILLGLHFWQQDTSRRLLAPAVLVPFAAWVMMKKKPDKITYAAVLIAMAGIYILNMSPGETLAFNLGNVLTMANLGAHTTSLKEMLDCLRTYIKETRTAGAVPVLITPLARNSWRDPTHYNDFLADFADAVLDLGKEEAVPVLDLHAYAMQLIRQEGLETAKRWFYPGDYTHTNDFGAYRMAGFVAGALGKAVGLPVADSPAWTPAPPFAPLTPPKDCALPAPDTDPFADYDATRPQEVLTRAEALELAIKALKLFPINVYNDLYADIVGHETYAGTVQCAAQNDLIPAAWIADGRLYPQRTVTAADFLAVLMPGAAGRRPLAAPSPLPDSVPAYARFAAGQAVAEQLISADSLNDPITRSDAAALCRRLHI